MHRIDGSKLRRLQALFAKAHDEGSPEPERVESAKAFCRELKKFPFILESIAWSFEDERDAKIRAQAVHTPVRKERSPIDLTHFNGFSGKPRTIRTQPVASTPMTDDDEFEPFDLEFGRPPRRRR